MKKIFLYLLLLPIVLPGQSVQWDAAKRFSATAGSTLTNTAAASQDGSTYLTGVFRGTISFDTLSVTAPMPGVEYGYLLKMNAAFKAEWIQVFTQKPYALTADPQGNVFVAGSHLKTTQSLDSLCYVAKYNPAGQLLGYFNSTGGTGYVRVVRTDAAGNCYLAGWMNTPTAFAGIAPPPAGGRDNFLVRLSPDLGQVHWATLTGTSNKLDEVYDMEVTADGFIYTSGNYAQTYNIFCPCYNGDFFLEKHNAADGISQWKRIFNGGSGTSTQQFVSVDTVTQAVFTGGSFKHTTTFAPGISLTAETGTDDYHIFLARCTTGGTVQWAQKVSQVGDSYPQGMVFLADHLLLHGYHLSTTLMGTFLLTPQGGADPFTVQVAPANGAVEFAEAFTGAGNDRGYGIDAGNGALVVSGNAGSNNPIKAGNFTLPGSSSSIYAARKTFLIPLAIQLTNVANASCPGTADGTATAAALGGTPPYSYSWSTGAQTASISGLIPGIYTVTATDAQGNQVSATTSISAPLPLALTAAPTAVSCAGSSDGSITLTATGGTPNYTYLWSGGQSGQNPAGLPAGTYTVTLTDANQCTATTSATVTEPTILTLAIAITEVSCHGSSDGSIFLSATGGTPNYTYLWSGGQSGQNPAGLPAGTYTVTLIDANQCTATTSATVVEPPVLALAAIINAVFCPGGSDGSITLTATGGTPNYTYSWSGGQSGQNPAGLPAGTYTVTLTDANQCTATTSATVTEPTILTLITAITEVSCHGGFDGSIFLTATGGTPNYTYSWSGGQSGQNPAGLPAGTYTVTLTDGNHCTATTSSTIIQPEALILTIENIIPATCAAGGAVAVVTTGGTPPFFFAWSNGTSGSSAVNLAGGTYQLTVTDSKGCTATLQADVPGGTDTEPPIIQGGDVEVELGTSGMVVLSENLMGVVITDHCGVVEQLIEPAFFSCADVGPHQVTITAADEVGNSASLTVTVTIVDHLAPTVICPANLVVCPAENPVLYDAPVATDNCLNMSSQGGDWELVSGLPSGSDFPIGETTLVRYTYTDSSGNAGACSFEVTVRPAVAIEIESVIPDTNFLGVGAIKANVTGGTLPYSYAWFKDGQFLSTTQNASKLLPGIYTLQVTDGSGCVFTSTFVEVVLDAGEPVWMNGVSLLPNPTSNVARIVFQSPSTPDLEINVLDLTGRVVAHLFAKYPTMAEIDCTQLPAGLYTVIFRSKEDYGVRKLTVQR